MFKSGDLIVQFVPQNATDSVRGIIPCRPFAVRYHTDDMMICVGEASNVGTKLQGFRSRSQMVLQYSGLQSCVTLLAYRKSITPLILTILARGT